MSVEPPEPREKHVSLLHGLWLTIFAVDAALVGRGWDHRLGAFLFLVFFSYLVVGELRSTDRDL